jgi:hypothetical protein
VRKSLAGWSIRDRRGPAAIEQRIFRARETAQALRISMSSYRLSSTGRPPKRRFGPRRALAGKHRAARVALHGGGYVAAYTVIMFVLYGLGIFPIDPIGWGRNLGVAAAPVGHVAQIVLWMGYASVCTWPSVSLWRCAHHTESVPGFYFARGASIACPVLCVALAALCVGVLRL